MEQYIKDQKVICQKKGVVCTEFNPNLKIGISDEVLIGLLPIHGLRHPPEGNTSGWYIWAGDKFSESEDFFKPYCIKHLFDKKSEIIKYLGLPAGYRFLIDNKGYEDIWFDEKLLDI